MRRLKSTFKLIILVICATAVIAFLTAVGLGIPALVIGTRNEKKIKNEVASVKEVLQSEESREKTLQQLQQLIADRDADFTSRLDVLRTKFTDIQINARPSNGPYAPPVFTPPPSNYPSFSAQPSPYPSFSAQPSPYPTEPAPPLSNQLMFSMNQQLLVTENPPLDHEVLQSMQSGGFAESSLSDRKSYCSFFTLENKVYCIGTEHGINNEEGERVEHLNQFRVHNAEVASFVTSGTIALLANYSETMVKLSDTWGWSFAVPFDGSRQYEEFDDALVGYVATKAEQSMRHFTLIGSNRDLYIGEFTTPKVFAPVLHIIRSSFVAGRSWSDTKTYSQTIAHVDNINVTADVLYPGKIVEFTGGKICKLIAVEPYPGAPLDVTQKVLRLETVDIMLEGDCSLRHHFCIHSILERAAAVYTTHEGPGELTTVDLSPLYSDLAPVVTSDVYNNFPAEDNDYLPRPWEFGSSTNYSYTGAHNLYVDHYAQKLWVLGSNQYRGQSIYDLRADHLHPVLETLLLTPNNTLRRNSYSHDVVTEWYTREEQMDLLGIPPQFCNDMLGIGFFSDETQYTLVNITALPAGVVDADADNRVFAVAKLRIGGGYYHQAWFTTDKRFVLISDEGQQARTLAPVHYPESPLFGDLYRFTRQTQARVPVFKIFYKNGTLALLEQQSLKSPEPVNVHNVYTRSNRRVRPRFIDSCGSPVGGTSLRKRHTGAIQNPGGLYPDCVYDPNTYYAAQPFEDYVYVSMYSAGTQVFRIRHRAGYDLNSDKAWEQPFDSELIGQISANIRKVEHYDGEWSNFEFGGFEFPAEDHIIGGNGMLTYRLSQLVPGLSGKMTVQEAYLNPIQKDFVLLSGVIQRKLANTRSGSSTIKYRGPVREDGDGDDHKLDPLPPTIIKPVTYIGADNGFYDGFLISAGIDYTLDVFLFEFLTTSTLPHAPALAQINSPIDVLYAWANERVTKVIDARISTDNDHCISNGFVIIPSTGDYVKEYCDPPRKSEIVVGGLALQRGESGASLVNADGELVGILRDSRQGTFGYIDVRNLRAAISGSAETQGRIASTYTGFWGIWNARNANISTDPADKILTLAINPRTNRLYQCLTVSGSPYHIGTLEFSGDVIDVESGEPTLLGAPAGFIDLRFVVMNSSLYDTAVANFDLGQFAANDVHCGGCILPVSGNVSGLLLYEELVGSFIAGGPRIVYLGTVGTRIIANVTYTLINFELVHHSIDVAGEPQFGGPYTDSPYFRRTIHPPNAGNVMISSETGIAITVAPGYVQTSPACPEWISTGIPSTASATIPLIGWWPFRKNPTGDLEFLSRGSAGQVFLQNYTLPFQWSGVSTSTAVLNTGMLGFGLVAHPAKYATQRSSLEVIEREYTPGNRFDTVSDGFILSVASDDFSVEYETDSDTLPGIIARFPIGSFVRVLVFRTSDFFFGYIRRRVLPKLDGNQFGLL